MNETPGQAVAMLEDKTMANGTPSEKVASAGARAAKPDGKGKSAGADRKGDEARLGLPGKPEKIDLLDIAEDNIVQIRVRVSDGQIDRFRRVYEGQSGDVARADPDQGVTRIRIVRDPDTKVNRLTDGMHRFRGAKAAGKTAIEAEVVPGKFNDAVIDASRANADQWGIPRTHADKINALKRVFALVNEAGDRYMEKMSHRAVANICKLDEKTVKKYREEITGKKTPEKVVRADGAVQDSARPRPNAEQKAEAAAAEAKISLDAKAKEWVAGLEGIRKLPKIAREVNSQAAIAWYKLVHSPEYADFGRLVRKTLKEVSNQHPVYRRAKAFLSLKSPADWKTCGQCDGTGLALAPDGKTTGKPCHVCKGMCLIP